MNLDVERAAREMDWYWHEDGQPVGADAPTGMVHREDCSSFDEETWTWWAEVTRLTPRLMALLPRASFPHGPYCPSCLEALVSATERADAEEHVAAALCPVEIHAALARTA